MQYLKVNRKPANFAELKALVASLQGVFHDAAYHNAEDACYQLQDVLMTYLEKYSLNEIIWIYQQVIIEYYIKSSPRGTSEASRRMQIGRTTFQEYIRRDGLFLMSKGKGFKYEDFTARVD